jgi:transcriptional regulator with XRE-family HTH domain
MSMNRHIRDTVVKFVDLRGLTQKELAEKTGLSQPAISRLLVGSRKGDPETWQRIFDALSLELTITPKEGERSQDPAWKQLEGLLDDPVFVTTEPGEIDRILGEAQEREHLEALAGKR